LLAQQLPDGVSTHIIVVDNDAQESARPIVAAFQGSPTSVEYLTQSEQNIALTRNRALDHSEGDLIGLIDDDESAPPAWLSTMLATMERHGADVVLGPVKGIPPAGAPQWIARGRFFERPVLPTGTRVNFQVGGTGNALVKASVIRGKMAFNPRYGLSGASDVDFFYRLFRNGALMVWCQEALLTEYVPEERARMRWLLRRGFRGGQCYADIVERPEGGIRFAGWLAKRTAFVIAATLLTVSCLPFSKALAVRYAIKTARSLGQVSTIFGRRYLEYLDRKP
jgi:succinoglycan biosynthesis protein ExoM